LRSQLSCLLRLPRLLFALLLSFSCSPSLFRFFGFTEFREKPPFCSRITTFLPFRSFHFSNYFFFECPDFSSNPIPNSSLLFPQYWQLLPSIPPLSSSSDCEATLSTNSPWPSRPVAPFLVFTWPPFLSLEHYTATNHCFPDGSRFFPFSNFSGLSYNPFWPFSFSNSPLAFVPLNPLWGPFFFFFVFLSKEAVS